MKESKYYGNDIVDVLTAFNNKEPDLLEKMREVRDIS